jgi:oligosaccharide reducing-end xylanase
MMQVSGRRRIGTAVFVSMVALFAGACGAPDDDPGAAVPSFAGPIAPTNDPNQPSGAAPSAPNDAVTPALPGAPASDEGTGELPLDTTPPASTPGTGDAPPPDSQTPNQPDQPTPEQPAPDQPTPEQPAPDEPVPDQPAPNSPAPTEERPTAGTRNLFTELLGIPVGEVDAKVRLAANRIFGIGTNESATPVLNTGYRVYYELPQNPNQAFIWAADSNDIRSEGMSYGMMIAVQLDMQQQFDRLWNFARTYMQFPANSNLTSWRYYFRWQGSVNTSNPSNWQVNYGADTGPAPDGDEYFAAALFLADRRWGSGGAINYRQEATNIASAMLNNAAGGGRTPVIDRGSNMVVFFPSGNSATFSDPSYHLPAFYELFAEDGQQADSARWRQIADTSRQYFVSSANASTGLHPDYANFNGTPNAGGSNHDQFRFDAWRVVMNMAVDYAWGSQDQRLKTQIEKYHSFFTAQLGDGNVQNSLFALNGSGASGSGSTALTATLASGALVSAAANRADYVQNLWEVGQQSGQYRYYQETVYMLGLLATSGLFGYEWAPQ